MARKKKKKHIFRNILLTVIILGILGGVCYFGYISYKEIMKTIEDVNGFTYEVPNEIGDKINLPSKIGDNITIDWTSSNETFISNSGNVTYPTFEEGDVKVTMTGKIEIKFKQFLSSFLIDILNKTPEDITVEINLKKKEATDSDKVISVINKLNLPKEIHSSINLPSTLCYEGIIITWDSLNDSILTDKGEVINPTKDTLVTLNAKVTSGDYEETKSFEINVLKDEPEITEIDDNFDNQAKTSRYKTVKSPYGVIYNNARIMLYDEHAEDNETDGNSEDINKLVDTFIRFRNQDENNGSFIIPLTYNPKLFSFDYKFSGTQKSNSKFVITYTTDSKDIKEEVIIDYKAPFTTYSKDLTEYKEVKIKVEFVEEWKGDSYVDIDNVKLLTTPSTNDLKDYIVNNTPTKVSKAIILPITTIYGGKLTWESNSDALTKDGIVTKQKEATTVTLTCTIEYLGEKTSQTIEVLVVGLNSKDALEIFFIDIGKYGAGDCGESIYIKFGNTDIIVDAGDSFHDTGKAVVEAINTRMQDDKIEYVIATHPDSDHIGGMPTLFDNFKIETLIKFEGAHSTDKYANFVKSYENEGCNIYDIGSDIINKKLGKKFITINNEIYIDFIDTKYYVEKDEKGNPMETNGRSIVFVLNAYGTKVLFTGDADNAPNHPHLEQNYMNEVGDIDILKVVHHGTRNGTDLDYLDVVDPEMAIICNGNYLGNKHGHPTPRAISNLYKHDPEMKVYAITGGGTIDGVANQKNGTYKCSSEDRFNQRNGLITITIDNNGYNAKSEYYNDNMMEMKNTLYYQAILANNLA